jgi:hypothetical protein
MRFIKAKQVLGEAAPCRFPQTAPCPASPGPALKALSAGLAPSAVFSLIGECLENPVNQVWNIIYNVRDELFEVHHIKNIIIDFSIKIDH